MRYAYIIIGIIVLLILFGVFFAFMRPGAYMASAPYGNNAYQANLASTGGNPCGSCANQTAYQLSPYPVYTATPATYTNASCPPTYTNTSGAASMWYTSPAYAQPGMYTYYYGTPTYTQNTVYPGSVYQVYPGGSNVYQYSYPGYSGGYYGGGYSYTYPQQPVYQQQQVQVGASASGGTNWYR